MWMQRLGRQLGALALLAMLVRALVPSGYMIAEADTPNGRYLVVQMCDGHGSAAQIVDLDTGKILDAPQAPGESGGKKTEAPCVFAVSAPMSSPPATAEPIVFKRAFEADFVAIGTVSPGRGIAAPPPPSTGPPTLI